ncbi:acylphosphatase [Candidatus Woesearchaeota archaeon]|nr:acylphosphatase [Candidatus Woesearchaeota archaeon]
MRCVKVLIEGEVQGVLFRHYTNKKADELNVKGYVKNLPDGSVEAVFYGKEDKVNEMIDFCKKGPSPAKVINVKIEEYNQEFDDFEIRY